MPPQDDDGGPWCPTTTLADRRSPCSFLDDSERRSWCWAPQLPSAPKHADVGRLRASPRRRHTGRRRARPGLPRGRSCEGGRVGPDESLGACAGTTSRASRRTPPGPQDRANARTRSAMTPVLDESAGHIVGRYSIRAFELFALDVTSATGSTPCLADTGDAHRSARVTPLECTLNTANATTRPARASRISTRCDPAGCPTTASLNATLPSRVGYEKGISSGHRGSAFWDSVPDGFRCGHKPARAEPRPEVDAGTCKSSLSERSHRPRSCRCARAVHRRRAHRSRC